MTRQPPHDREPRKVIVGTSIFPHARSWSGLDERLATLCGMIDTQQRMSQQQYGRGADLIVFTEHAITGGSGRTAAEKAHTLEGPILDTFAAKARQYRSNLCLPMHLDEGDSTFTNAAVMVDRSGEVAGVYRKLFPVNGYACAGDNPELLEAGITPGRNAEVFDLDFGRVGVQICWDMSYDDGWAALQAQHAELVIWSTASPRAFAPAMRAARHGYWVVSATPRCNAGVYEPVTGQPLAQVRPPDTLLVSEIDLSWLCLPWSPDLKDGRAFTEAFGDAVGYHYLAEEDCGLFWSNDAQRSIGQMCREVGIDPDYNRADHCRRLRDGLLG